MDGAVEGRWCGVGKWRGGWQKRGGAEEEEATGTRAGVALGEVGGIAVNVQDHVAGVIA